MNIKVCKNYSQLSAFVTNEIINQIKNKPDSMITIAGGDTPKGVYELLSKRLVVESINYSKVKFVSLDEWVGLDINTKGSCHETLNEYLFKNLQLRDDQIYFFVGSNDNLTTECNRINKIIEEHGGIDLMILGVGMNGHLGFNEPYVETGNASVVSLAPKTIEVMSKYFESKLSLTHGITLGYNQILGSKKLILMASGSNKKEIITKTISEEVSIKVPSTMVKKHKNSFLCIDEEAQGYDEKN